MGLNKFIQSGTFAITSIESNDTILAIFIISLAVMVVLFSLAKGAIDDNTRKVYTRFLLISMLFVTGLGGYIIIQ